MVPANPHGVNLSMLAHAPSASSMESTPLITSIQAVTLGVLPILPIG